MDYKTALFLELSNFFYQFKYELLLHKDQFRKPTSVGFQNVIFSVSQYEEMCYIQVNLGLRVHQVEEFVHQFTNYSLDFKTDSNTIILSIGKFLEKPQFKYQAKNEQELKQVCQEIEDFMNVAGFYFLENNASIASLDRLINRFPEQINKYFYNLLHGCMKGLIIAKLNHNSALQDLSKMYLERLQKNGYPENQIQNFVKLSNFLQNFSLN